MIRTFELSRESREFGRHSDLLDAFRKLCETSLDHQSLARPLGFGAERDIPFLVYSELAGTSMVVVMQQHGVRPVAEVLRRARQLADAIDVAASAGVYHGMIAPGDVFLDGEDTGIMGFGVAQALIKAGIPAEATPPYGSPQRIAGAPPTTADDVYSLAAITLELLIGTPRDPDEATRALREAQGLPERRRMPRPAPHETRVFTTLPGVDAGKLRAAFAAAFSEEPSERPSTASAFVASFEEAFANKRAADEPAPIVVAAPPIEVAQDPPSPPALETKHEEEREEEREEEAVTVDPPSPQKPVVANGRAARRRRARERRREKLAMSQPLLQEPQEPEPPAPKPEQPAIRVIRAEPIDDVDFLPEVAPPRSLSIAVAPQRVPVQSGPRSLLVAGIVAATAASFAAGFGGGFIVGQRSVPSTGPTHVAKSESITEPQPTRVVAEEPIPIPSATPTAAPALPPRATSAVETGRLLVRSTPAGASVMIDGQSRGVTPLDLRDIATGVHTIEVSHPGHDTRRQRVTLSERRPARSIDVRLRPTSVPAAVTASSSSTNSSGSLQVASRPSGAQVFVDDTLIGTTPLLMSDVAAGARRVRIELSGYRIWTTSVQIEPSARFRVSASLEP